MIDTNYYVLTIGTGINCITPALLCSHGLHDGFYSQSYMTLLLHVFWFCCTKYGKVPMVIIENWQAYETNLWLLSKIKKTIAYYLSLQIMPGNHSWFNSSKNSVEHNWLITKTAGTKRVLVQIGGSSYRLCNSFHNHNHYRKQQRAYRF